MKRVFITICLLSMVLLVGCATIKTSKLQSVPVMSEPSGARIITDTGESIVTPDKLLLIRNEAHILTAVYPGYVEQQLLLRQKNQCPAWGGLFGAVAGFVVEVISGASDELVPDAVYFDFTDPLLTTRGSNKEVRKAVYKKYMRTKSE